MTRGDVCLVLTVVLFQMNRSKVDESVDWLTVWRWRPHRDWLLKTMAEKLMTGFTIWRRIKSMKNSRSQVRLYAIQILFVRSDRQANDN